MPQPRPRPTAKLRRFATDVVRGGKIRGMRPVTARMCSWQRETLDQLAAQRRLTRSQLVRDLVEDAAGELPSPPVPLEATGLPKAMRADEELTPLRSITTGNDPINGTTGRRDARLRRRSEDGMAPRQPERSATRATPAAGERAPR
jgi:hypothetical protein